MAGSGVLSPSAKLDPDAVTIASLYGEPYCGIRDSNDLKFNLYHMSKYALIDVIRHTLLLPNRTTHNEAFFRRDTFWER